MKQLIPAPNTGRFQWRHVHNSLVLVRAYRALAARTEKAKDDLVPLASLNFEFSSLRASLKPMRENDKEYSNTKEGL